MRIYRHSKTEKWFVDYRHAGKRERYVAGSSERAAHRLRLRIELEIAEGRHQPAALRAELQGKGPAGSATVSEVIEAFLANYTSRGGTEYYQHLTKPLAAQLGSRVAADVSGPVLTGYVQARRAIRTANGDRRVCDNTIRKELTVLSTVYRWARGAGYPVGNPMVDFVRPPKPGERGIAILAPEQEAALLAALDRDARDVAEWAIYSGMRRGEILDLEWSNLDLTVGLIRVLPREQGSSKTGAARTIPLDVSVRLRAILARRARGIHGGRVFGQRDGTRLDCFALNRAVEAAADAAQIPRERGVIFNRFRHTFATRLAATGRVSIFEIAKWMGNSVSVCEKHYAAYLPGSVERAAGLLDGPAVAAPETPAISSGAVSVPASRSGEPRRDNAVSV